MTLPHPILGIDLGTSYCAVAVIQSSSRPQIIPVDQGSNRLASQIYFDDSGPIVGHAAKEAALRDPSRFVEKFKLRMGEPVPCFVDSHGKPYTAGDLSAIVLKRLRDEATTVLGVPVTDVTIAVPAHFTQAQRRDTMNAGASAGLNVLGLVEEPTAAALSYGMEKLSEGSTVMVYDLGGGTFDISLLRREGTSFTVLGVDGDQYLGGLDFDERLLQFYVQTILNQHGIDPLQDEALMLEVQLKTESAKRLLSRTSEARDFIKVGNATATIRITRQKFEELTNDLMQRTAEVMRRSLKASRLTWADIDHVLLVGGSTWMPMVKTIVRQVSGKEPSSGINPDEAVATGAALYGWMVSNQDRSHPRVYASSVGATPITSTTPMLSTTLPMTAPSYVPPTAVFTPEVPPVQAPPDLLELDLTEEHPAEAAAPVEQALPVEEVALIEEAAPVQEAAPIEEAAPVEEVELPPAIVDTMVPIPGGDFQMGTEGVVDESPVRLVTLGGFHLSAFPVTNDDYREFCDATNRPYPENPAGWGEYFLECPMHPVVMVTWDDAVAYCEWLSARTERVFRLPTEAEWEYAARAGSLTNFPWGDDIEEDQQATCARYVETTPANDIPTAAVGSYQPNAFALYDMHGNVLEWCQDWYSRNAYDGAPARSPRGPETGRHRVCRGGSWAHDEFFIRSASRLHFPPGFRANFLGFRIAAER